MDSQQCRIQEDAMCRVYFICGCNVSDKGDNDYTADTVSSSINMEQRVLTLLVVIVVRACDNDVSHQNRTDNLDLAKILKAFIKLNSRRMNYFGTALQCFATIVNNDVWCQIIVNGYCYKGGS